MFCARCGKEIDNDSAFCLYCGQMVGSPVERIPAVQKSAKPVKQRNKKVIGGIVAAFAALLIVTGIVKLAGYISNKNESLSEKLFAMSWEEISELSEDDLEAMLDQAGILYRIESEKESLLGVRGMKTEIADSFMGGDCLSFYTPDAFLSMYVVRYETEEDYKEGRELLEQTLKEQLVENTDVFEEDFHGTGMKYYPIAVSGQNIDKYMDRAGDTLGDGTLEDLYYLNHGGLKEHPESRSQFSMYKFAFTAFGTSNDLPDIANAFDFPGNKDYTDSMCVFGTLYVPLREEDMISNLALNGCYDAIAGEKIDIEKFKSSVNERLMDTYLNENASDNQEYRRALEEKTYRKLYMMEKHKFDTDARTRFKTDDEKRVWYTCQFNWDTATDAPIDLSDYRDSGAIYCAVECNYNSDTAQFFESELDRALYLADRDYQLGSGWYFGSAVEKRLWFMQNYSYDISEGKAIDKEVVDALIAYQNYIDSDEKYYVGYNLLYIDEDNIPELLAEGDCEASGHKLITLCNGTISEDYISRLGGIRYAEKKNFYYNSNGHMGYYYDDFYKLVDGKQTEIASGNFGDKYDEEGNIIWDESEDWPVQEYFWNGAACSGEKEYSDAIDDFIKSSIGDVELKRAVFSEHYVNTLEAYDALRSTIYETYEYSVCRYELKDGVLTVAADDGVDAPSEFGLNQPFEFSYPVAEDCIWEERTGYGRYYSEYINSAVYPVALENIESDIRNWRGQYENNPKDIESPTAIQFSILNNKVIKVYILKPYSYSIQ